MINSTVFPSNIIWKNKEDINTMLVLNTTLKFYWSKKSVALRITDLELHIQYSRKLSACLRKPLQIAGESAFHTVRNMINYLFGLVNRIYVPMILWHGSLNFLALAILLS